MLVVTTRDGDQFTGENPRAVVRDMKRRAWLAPPGKQAYMIECVERVRELTGHWITDADAKALTPTRFLTYLVGAGMVQVMDLGGGAVDGTFNSDLN